MGFANVYKGSKVYRENQANILPNLKSNHCPVPVGKFLSYVKLPKTQSSHDKDTKDSERRIIQITVQHTSIKLL